MSSSGISTQKRRQLGAVVVDMRHSFANLFLLNALTLRNVDDLYACRIAQNLVHAATDASH